MLALHDIYPDRSRLDRCPSVRVRYRRAPYVEPVSDDDFFDRHVCKAAGIRLMSLIEHRVKRFLYVYDFGERLEARHFIESFGDGEGDVAPDVVLRGSAPGLRIATAPGLP